MSGQAAIDAALAERHDSPVRFDRVRAIVKDALAPLVTRIDQEGFYPEEVLRQLGAAGAYGAHVAGAAGGAHLWDAVQSIAFVAEECLSTAFCMWCQDACAWYLKVTP